MRRGESAQALPVSGIERGLLPCVQINAVAPRLARGVNGEERLSALAFTADGERVKKLVPALRSFFQIRSCRTALQPRVQLHRHWCEELSLVHSISQMVPIGAAPGVSWRPYPHCRHSLTDGVYDLLGNTLRLFRAGMSLLEAGVEVRERLILCSGRFTRRSLRGCTGTPLTLLRRCHVVMVTDAVRAAKARIVTGTALRLEALSSCKNTQKFPRRPNNPTGAVNSVDDICRLRMYTSPVLSLSFPAVG